MRYQLDSFYFVVSNFRKIENFNSLNIIVLQIAFILKKIVILRFKVVHLLVCLSVCVCLCLCLFVSFFVCVCVFNSCSTLRVSRSETRLTVYRSSYISLIRRVIPVRWSLARLFPPRFSVTIDKSCIVKPTIMMLVH